MLLTLALWAVMLAAATSAGAALWRAFGGAPDLAEREDRFAANAWTGLLCLSSLLLWMSLAGPLKHFGWIVFLMAPACLAVPAVRGDWRKAMPGAGRLAGVSLVCAAATSGVVMLHDTGLYHYGMQRWLSEAGTVRGLALISYRFGFTSSWTALGAALDGAAPWSGRAAAAANGFAFALLLYQLLVAVRRARAGACGRGDAYVLAAYPVALAFSMAQRLQVSASPNLGAAAGVAALGWLLLSTRGAASLAMAGALAAVKLTAVPALAVAAMAARRSSRFVPAVAAAAALAVPIAIAAKVATGCPLFPAPLFCAAEGEALAREISTETRDWARYRGPYPEGGAWLSAAWIGGWFGSPLNAAFFAVSVAGAAFATLRRAWSMALALGLAGFAWVMTSAPDFRLGFGYAAVLAGCAAAARDPGTKPWRLPVAPLICAMVLLDAAAHEAGYWLVLGREEARPRIERLVVPPEIRRPRTTRAEVNGVELYYPEGEPGIVCWGAPVPCTIAHPDPGLRYCDPSRGAAGGFCRGPR